jgi:hypothetical protein
MEQKPPVAVLFVKQVEACSPAQSDAVRQNLPTPNSLPGRPYWQQLPVQVWEHIPDLHRLLFAPQGVPSAPQ